MRSTLAAVVIALGSLTAAGLQAQDKQAQDKPPSELSAEERDHLGREEFIKATEAYDRADYSAALKHFERALELSERAMLYYNIALVHERLQNDKTALQSYEKFLELVDKSEHHPHARARAQAIRDAIAKREREEQAKIEQARKEAAEQAAAQAIASHPPEETGSTWLWVGIGAGVVAVGAGIAIAVLASGGDPEYQSGDFGPATKALVEF